MTEQIDLRATALLAAQESASQTTGELGLLYAQWAEALHRLADRDDALEFTEPSRTSSTPPTLALNLREVRILARVTNAYLDVSPYDQRVKDLLDRAQQALS